MYKWGYPDYNRGANNTYSISRFDAWDIKHKEKDHIPWMYLSFSLAIYGLFTTSRFKKPGMYPLVNIYIATEKITMLNGKTHYFYGHVQ